MSELVVFTYQHPDRAAEVLQHVASLQREHIRKPLVTIEDAAVAVKGTDGQVRVRQTLETAMKARTVATGSLWGVLVGFLFGGPLVGALVGNAVPSGLPLDFALPITFLAMIGPMLRTPAHVVAALTSVTLAL
ncbi:MAG: hypothetical protein P1P87_03550, partial [Trueperaceae bacterium]|nr:hypothetical protein [Trueperaceae bacterium]